MLHLFESPGGIARPASGQASALVCSLASVKAQLGIAQATATYDDTLTAWVEIVADAIAGDEGLGRPFVRQRAVAQMPGPGGHYLVMPRWPVERVVSVTYGITNPETVDETSYSIASASGHGGALGSRDRLYCSDGWRYSNEHGLGGATWDTLLRQGSGQAWVKELDYAVDFYAGWLMTDECPTWAASTMKTVGAFVKATAASTLLRFECTTAGTAGESEPTWPTTEGETVSDGTVVWTARGAAEVPVTVQMAATIQAAEWFRGGLSLPAGIASEASEDHRIDYDLAALRGDVPPLAPFVRALLRPYR